MELVKILTVNSKYFQFYFHRNSAANV